jgi:hypothetical protein
MYSTEINCKEKINKNQLSENNVPIATSNYKRHGLLNFVILTSYNYLWIQFASLFPGQSLWVVPQNSVQHAKYPRVFHIIKNTFLYACEHFDLLMVGGNICRSTPAMTQPPPGWNRKGKERWVN